MLRRTVITRLAATRTALAVSPFALFLKRTAGMLKGIPLRTRGRKLGALYRALPRQERAALAAAAARTPRPKPKPKPRRPRKLAPFARFVKANFKSVRRLPASQRLKALAAKWRQQKKGRE